MNHNRRGYLLENLSVAQRKEQRWLASCKAICADSEKAAKDAERKPRECRGQKGIRTTSHGKPMRCQTVREEEPERT